MPVKSWLRISAACRSHSLHCAFSAWIAARNLVGCRRAAEHRRDRLAARDAVLLEVVSASVSASDWKIVARVGPVAAPVIWSSVEAYASALGIALRNESARCRSCETA